MITEKKARELARPRALCQGLRSRLRKHRPPVGDAIDRRQERVHAQNLIDRMGGDPDAAAMAAVEGGAR